MSIFAGYAQQAAALPTRPQRRGLFGGRGPSINWDDVANFVVGGPRYVGEQRDEARQQQRALADQQWRRAQAGTLFPNDPQARVLFEQGNETFLNSLGEQYAPQVVGAGAAQVVAGRRTVEQPTYSESGDTILERSSQGVRPVFTRTTPSITEGIQQQNADTARLNANNPINVAPGGQLRDPRTGALVAEGAPRIFAAGDAVDLVTDTGQQIYQNPRDAIPTSMVPTEAQAKDRFNTERMTGAVQTITQLEAAGYDPTLRSVTGLFGDDRARQYQAAALEWADSLLRMTTGAAATRDEIENAVTTYFPQPGDSPQVRAQKAAARERVVASAQTRAAPGNRQVPGQAVTVSSPAEAQALPPGTRYRTPQGQEYIR